MVSKNCIRKYLRKSVPNCNDSAATIVTEELPRIRRAIGKILISFLYFKKTAH